MKLTEEDVKNFKIEDFSNTASLKDVRLVTGEIAIKTGILDEELLKAFDKDKTEKEDGDFVYYLEDTNEFVVLSKDGYIRTYFRPSGGKKYFDKRAVRI